MYGDGDIGNNTVKTRFNVRNLIWELEVKPGKGWFSIWEIFLSMLIILLLSGFIGIITYMMIQLRESNALLLRLSTTDVLTGCYNRRAYEEKITELSSKKTEDDFVYVSADVNGLKQVNDTLGHNAGDELIAGAQWCLQNVFGPYGSIYRIGGDEFAALICANEETLAEIMEKLNSNVDSWRGQSVDRISVSVGYAAHSEYPDMTIEELGKAADQKMYESNREYYQKHDRRGGSL